MYHQSVKNKTAGEIATDDAKDIKDTAKSVVQDVETAAKNELK